MIIDFHTHVTTQSYLTKLLRMKSAPKITREKNGTYRMWFDDKLNYSFDERTYTVDKKIDDMKKAKVDILVLGLSLPGVDLFEPKLAADLARGVNDEISEIADKHEEFIGIATVPLLDASAPDELDRAVNSLGLKGVEIFSNVGGKSLESEDFWPFYEKAEKLDVPVLIHPTKPVMVDALRDFGLTGAVGYLFDTTLAMLKIIFGGVLEKYKKLKFVLPHAGSTIPYLIGRIDHQFKINPESQEKISKLPSEYFKSVYIDTAQAFYEPALMCAYNLVGPERTIFGSDYPFASLEQALNCVKTMKISAEEKEKILSKNAMKILKIS